MKHFDISDWADFGRGVRGKADRAAMDAHLSSGCLRCRATLDLVTRIVASSGDDSRYEPPADAVRWAKAISALQAPKASPLFRLIPRLVYDSLSDPLPIGIRAEDRVSHHALFEAGEFQLDLRVEQEKGSPLVTLVGQLTNGGDPDLSLAEAPVLVTERKSVVAHTVYNQFGEFQMDFAPSRLLRLCVALDPPTRHLELSLSRLLMPGMTKSLPIPPKAGLFSETPAKRPRSDAKKIVN
jgi:hypothetical protein